MSDLGQMARSTAHVLAADVARSGAAITEAHLADAFQRGALWAMARATHALAITLTAARSEPEAHRAGIERAQRAIVTTHEKMRQDAAEGVTWPRW